jgi:hypothetical protein
MKSNSTIKEPERLPLVTNGDDLTIGKLIAFFERRRLRGRLELLLEVERDIAQLLFDITDDFAFRGRGERVTTFGEVLDEGLSDVTASEIQAQDSMRQCKALIDRDGVRNTVTGVKYDPGRTTRGIQGKNGLNLHVKGGRVENFEHDLGHLFSVGLGVERGLGKENRVLFRRNAQLIVERVVPDLLHIVPIGDDAVLDRVLQGQDTALRLRLISAV